jgi:hypothetical protein
VVGADERARFCPRRRYARQHIAITKLVVAQHAWSGFTIVRETDWRGDTSFHCYQGDAWTRPSEQPLSPLAPPTGEPVAHIDIDGIGRSTRDHHPAPRAKES